jgi:predicted DNA-binding transcriptional regulator YafY
MRRADRLFQIVQLIRGRRLTTARWLAQRLEVSERTVYRDVADLQYQGVPIEGEAGVGYRLGEGFDLPPLIFTPQEAQALVVMTRVAQQWLDPALARASESALSRVLSVLPADQRHAAQHTPVYSPPWGLTAEQQPHLQLWREATQGANKLALVYSDAQARTSERTVWPLGSFFWGAVWTLVAWCEKRQDFRSFRLDRIQSMAGLPQAFRLVEGQRLIDYLRQQGVDPQVLAEGR